MWRHLFFLLSKINAFSESILYLGTKILYEPNLEIKAVSDPIFIEVIFSWLRRSFRYDIILSESPFQFVTLVPLMTLGMAQTVPLIGLLKLKKNSRQRFLAANLKPNLTLTSIMVQQTKDDQNTKYTLSP